MATTKELTEQQIIVAAQSAFVLAQAEFGPALKTATNPHFRSKYAALDGCVEAVLDGLHSNGLALTWESRPNDSGVEVQCVLLHEKGGRIESGWLFVPAAKRDPQGFGSALTYARRYTLMSACGIAPEDDDGNAATSAVQAAPAKRKPSKQTCERKLATSNTLAELKREWDATPQEYRAELAAIKDETKARLSQPQELSL